MMEPKPYTIEELREQFLEECEVSGIPPEEFFRTFKEKNLTSLPIEWKRCSVCDTDVREDCINISLVTGKNAGIGGLTVSVALLGKGGSVTPVPSSRIYSFHERCLDDMVRGEAEPIQEVLDYLHMEAQVRGEDFGSFYHVPFKRRARAVPFNRREICYSCWKPIDGQVIIVRRCREGGEFPHRGYYTDLYIGCVTLPPKDGKTFDFYNFHVNCFDVSFTFPKR